MNILLVNTFSSGGAANACLRLHKGINGLNASSNLLILSGNKNFLKSFSYYNQLSLKKKIYSKIINRLYSYTRNKVLKNRSKNFEIFTFPETPYNIKEYNLYKKADIINLHWVADFIDYKSFFRENKKKLVWTLHDMNPFTGGCHYSGECLKYRSDCNTCYQLANTGYETYSNKILNTKFKSLNNLSDEQLTIVSPSKWLMELSKSSRILSRFEHFHIPNGVDSKVFQPQDKNFSRKLLSLPPDKKIILFVSDSITNYRKGYSILLKALEMLPDKENTVLCSIGSKSTTLSTGKVLELGSITEELLMSVAYSAADVFVIPSLEDNLPNTVLESLMCGTPVIGFPIGGVQEMIVHNQNGFLCEEISETALKNEIEKFLENPAFFDRQKIREHAVKNYDISVQANRYIKLYKKILQR